MRKDKTDDVEVVQEQRGTDDVAPISRERGRVSQILALGKQWDRSAEAMEAAANGTTVAQFRGFLLSRFNEPAPVIFSQTPPTIDMPPSDSKRYSVCRALRVAGDMERDGGLELEVSNTISKKLGRQTRDKGLFIPLDLRVQAAGPLSTRALQTKVDSAGGYTVAVDVLEMIELLRNRMMTRALGASIFSGLQGNVSFPRQATASSLSWVGENPGSDLADSDATFDQVTLSPRTAMSTTGYTRQLLAQSSLDVENFVRTDLATISALGLDLAAINGSGVSGQPLGILQTTGIGSVAGGTNGLAPTWAHIVELETDVATANADLGRLGYLTNAAVRGKLKTVEKASNTGLFVWEPDPQGRPGMGMLAGYPAGVSNQVPSNLTKGSSNDCSAIIFGDWSSLLIGEWGTLEVVVDPFTLKKQAIVEVTSFLLADIALRHASSFSAMQDALTT